MGVLATWAHHWLYDWNGANRAIFLAFNTALPDAWLWLAEALTALGSYWGAPAVLALLLAVPRLARSDASKHPAATFVLGLMLAAGAGAFAKHALAFPRPSDVLGAAVYRAFSPPDTQYSLPSGHSLYVGVVAATVWPILGGRARACLLSFAAAVGWSRVALGAHFPADVVAGLALGWASVALARRAFRTGIDSA